VAIAGIATTKESARRADEKTTGRTANQTQQRARSRGTASRNPAVHGTNSMWQDQHAHNRTIDDDGSRSKRDENRSRTKGNSNLFKRGESPKLLITFLLQMSSAPNRAWLKTPRIWIVGPRMDCHSTTRRSKKNSKSFTRKISISSLTEATSRSSH
jgi:hypothetical protein